MNPLNAYLNTMHVKTDVCDLMPVDTVSVIACKPMQCVRTSQGDRA